MDYPFENKENQMSEFVKVDSDKVRSYWSCMNEDCTLFDKAEFFVNPDWHMENGTPVCDECNTDMCFDHVEVEKE